jgi:hypothetical protein
VLSGGREVDVKGVLGCSWRPEAPELLGGGWSPMSVAVPIAAGVLAWAGITLAPAVDAV